MAGLRRLTPGIISNNRAPSVSGVTLDAPAAAEGTVRCIALPAGGLAPLPGLSAALTAELPAVPLLTAVGGVHKATGLWSVGPMWEFTSFGQRSADFKGQEIHQRSSASRQSLARCGITSWSGGSSKPTSRRFPTPVVIADGQDISSLPNLQANCRGVSRDHTRESIRLHIPRVSVRVRGVGRLSHLRRGSVCMVCVA